MSEHYEEFDEEEYEKIRREEENEDEDEDDDDLDEDDLDEFDEHLDSLEKEGEYDEEGPLDDPAL